MTSDTILAFREFAYRLPKEKRDKLLLFYTHNQLTKTEQTYQHIVEELCPDLNIIFSTNKLSSQTS